MDQDKVYQRIGDFVVSFQFLEDLIRQIGWLLIDPARKVWPPKALRKLKSEDLADKVAELYGDTLHFCRLPDEADRRLEFPELIKQFHEFRKFRNRVLHSAFIELKAGGEVQALIRTDVRLKTDPETGETLMDHESLSETSFQEQMAHMGHLAFRLGSHHLTLIARLPTD